MTHRFLLPHHLPLPCPSAVLLSFQIDPLLSIRPPSQVSTPARRLPVPELRLRA
jgi:hypothetical protein